MAPIIQTAESPKAYRPPTQPGSLLEAIVLTTARWIDRFTYYTGWLFGTIAVILMGIIVYHVVMRYVFGAPTYWAYDMTYMLYGSGFMLGAAFALLRGAHVRTDFLYQNWSERTQGIVDSILYLCLFFPAMVLFFDAGYAYAERSWGLGERGYMSPWQPVIYPFKTVIPVAIVLIMIQGVSETLKSLFAAFKGFWPVVHEANERGERLAG